MLAINVELVPKIRFMGFVSYKSPWIHFKRNVDEYILYFIKSGELHIEENGVPYVLRKGDVFMLEPNLDHEGLEKHACDYYYIHFSHSDIQALDIPDLLTLAKRIVLEEDSHSDQHDNTICYFPKHFTLSHKTSLHHAFHTMNEMVQLYRRKHYNEMLIALTFSGFLIEVSREHLITKLQKNSSKHTKSFMKVNSLLDYIHQHYSQKITSVDIEQEFECNFDYINRIFKQVTGHTITRYVNLIRINHAKELIQATHLSIGEIGYLTGLNDPYYFSKVFKNYVGMSPIQYSKKIKEHH
ncbi:AraC family transcriptional regulator [Paenibacillus abyssi]|uniref:AraC family transcriptional regulator n=1 Tax=Paenibacillus abyssi TaxID=1340531 RepID=A0A917D005_9BACL|nr:AraC family transcriptional regulator [Paenibacillus abyssi]GGG04338.1 AraC family transcriptional regulator [Paenibacillus abyssi]